MCNKLQGIILGTTPPLCWSDIKNTESIAIQDSRRGSHIPTQEHFNTKKTLPLHSVKSPSNGSHSGVYFMGVYSGLQGNFK
jgi:hypothetical protein